MAHEATSLRYAGQIISHCDGSSIASGQEGPGLGAGVFREYPDGTTQATRIDPGLPEGRATINHAELVAILVALRHSPAHQQHVITSDSACALWQIAKMIHRPQDMEFHKHADTLDAIRLHLEERAQRGAPPVRLLKVRAHNGVVGNERAEEIAKAAARGTDQPDESFTWSENQNHDKHVWVFARGASQASERRAKRRKGAGTDESAAPEHDEVDEAKPIPNKEGVRKHMHERLKLGKSNTDTAYFARWRKLKGVTNGKLSNGFLVDTKTRHGQRRITLQYRMGTIWNQRRACMMKLTTDSKCPLCHEEDGNSHIATNCKHDRMHRMYTDRHNAVARVVLKCIQEGSYGGYIQSADVGCKDKCQAEGIRHIPSNTVPRALLEACRTHHTGGEMSTKPDILLTIDPDEHNPKPRHIIVEVKTCNDTRYEDQLQRAKAQHAALSEALKKTSGDHRVEVIPILAGVGGSIYEKHTIEQLLHLGVARGKALEGCAKIHRLMAHKLHAIVVARRQLEKPKDNRRTKHPGRPPERPR